MHLALCSQSVFSVVIPFLRAPLAPTIAIAIASMASFGEAIAVDRTDASERWSHLLRQPAKVDSPMRRTNHHEDTQTVFG